jgi:hypothetical protein
MMPFKNPFFFSKRAISKLDKIREQQKKEFEHGPQAPASVNNAHTITKLTVGQSKNVHTRIADPDPSAKNLPEKINNFEVNKPVAAKSLNQYPAETIMPREVQEVIPAVNGKAAPQHVHKTVKKDSASEDFPVIEKKKDTKKPRRRSTKKKTPSS